MFMIKLIRRIPRDMTAPLVVDLVVCPTCRGDGHGECGVVDKVPHGRVTDILMALDPGVGWVSHPRGHRHDQRIDTGICPLMKVLPLILGFLEL